MERLADTFEDGTIDHCDFGHRQHVGVAWALIKRHGLERALAIFSEGLIRITAEAGVPNKYHATVTHALMQLIAQRIEAFPAETFDEFADQNPELLSWPSPPLEDMYPNGELDLPEARVQVIPARFV